MTTKKWRPKLPAARVGFCQQLYAETINPYGLHANSWPKSTLRINSGFAHMQYGVHVEVDTRSRFATTQRSDSGVHASWVGKRCHSTLLPESQGSGNAKDAHDTVDCSIGQDDWLSDALQARYALNDRFDHVE